MPNVLAPMPNWSTKVNITATKSGNASDPTVWGRALAAGDFFKVPAGMTITWDLTSCPNLAGYDNYGIIDAGSAPGNKVMNIATAVNESGSIFKCGDCIASPNVPLTGTFTLTFTDTAPDATFDPGQFGTGLIAMGATVNMCGSLNKTSWANATGNGLGVGATSLTLAVTPSDWQVGDQLIIPTTGFNYYVGNVGGPDYPGYQPLLQDEIVTIQSIAGATVTFTPALVYDHHTIAGPQAQVYPLPVGNLSRRIVFQSANPSGTRGHVMFMKDMMTPPNPSIVDACHVLLKDLGRTFTDSTVTDPLVDSVTGVLVAGTADNPRGRYSWHSHRQGQASTALQTWTGLVVQGFKKWGFVNHDSNVNATGLLAYNGQGACFSTERGTEIGTFTNCLGGRTTGAPETVHDPRLVNPDIRTATGDFGWGGNCVWMQGPGVTISGCVGWAHAGNAYHLWGNGDQAPWPADVVSPTFPEQYLLYPQSPLTGVDPFMHDVPMFGFTNNTAFASAGGFQVEWSEPDPSKYLFPPNWDRTVVLNFIVHNCFVGLNQSYCENLKITGSQMAGIIASPTSPAAPINSCGMDANSSYTLGGNYDNNQVANFEVGVRPSTNGGFVATITGAGYWANVVDFSVAYKLGDVSAEVKNAIVFQNTPTFGAVSSAVLAGRTRLNVRFENGINVPLSTLPLYFSGDFDGPRHGFGMPFTPWHVQWSDGSWLYASTQAGSFVPFPTGQCPGCPVGLLGQTNSQLQTTFGTSISNAAANGPPPTTFVSDGYQGPAQTLSHYWSFVGQGDSTGQGSPYPTVLTNYQLTLYDVIADPNALSPWTDPTVVTLVPGWQVLTRTNLPTGGKQSFLVYGPTV